MDFKVDFGPWETIFIGKFYSHDVEIIVNPEQYFLTIIYEKEEGKNIGALIDGSKALVARGPLESFVQTLPKTATGIIKTNGNKTSKLIFIGFDPIYLDFRKDDFVRKLDNAIKKSFENLNTIRGLAKSSSLELKETNMVPKSEYNQILGDPLMARNLLSGLKKSAMELINLSDNIPTMKTSSGQIQLGLNKNREIIKEKIENIYRTILIGKENKSINYTAYILTENFLLDNNTTIIFDSDNYFNQLGESSKHEHELREALVEFEPAGFPIKKFKAKEDIKIPLKNIDLALAFNILKVNDPNINKIVSENKIDANTVKEYLDKINEIKASEFEKLKIYRLLKIIEKEYGGLFGEGINTKELIKKWSGSLGRATVINISKLNKNEKLFFVLGILSSINNVVDKIKNNDLVLVLPQMSYLFKKDEGKIIEKILTLEDLGLGFVIGTDNPLEKLIESSTNKINIIQERDIAISIKNKRNYRVILRPSISGDPQTR